MGFGFSYILCLPTHHHLILHTRTQNLDSIKEKIAQIAIAIAMAMAMAMAMARMAMSSLTIIIEKAEIDGSLTVGNEASI